MRRPELSAAELIVWEAFQSLSSDRQIGFGGAGPLMWSSVDRYAERYGISGDDFDVLDRLLRALDEESFKHRPKK